MARTEEQVTVSKQEGGGMTRVTKQPVYVVFDRDNRAVRDSLQAQARAYDCPFLVIERPAPDAAAPCADELRQQIAASSCVLVLCTEETSGSPQIARELALARELGKPYVLLRGTCKSSPTLPSSARPGERIWAFRWCNVSALLAGKTPAADQLVA